MGDRGNIHVKEDNNDCGIYFYSHWGGSELPLDLQRALARKIRWDDGAYLNKIILNGITGGDISGETGIGISTSIRDNEHDIIEVNVKEKTVSFSGKKWTFNEYISVNLEPILEEINF